MNKKILIAGAAVCAVIVSYFVLKMKARRPLETISEKKSHHLTDVFVRAKNHSNNIISDI
jgi:hypothetical protein